MRDGHSFKVFITVASSIFIAELTDKDALLILALSTRIKPFIVFVSGLVAFTITTAVVVTIGDFLLSISPVDWITLSGAVIMIGYGIWLLLGIKRDGEDLTEKESNLLARSVRKPRRQYSFGSCQCLCCSIWLVTQP